MIKKKPGRRFWIRLGVVAGLLVVIAAVLLGMLLTGAQADYTLLKAPEGEKPAYTGGALPEGDIITLGERDGRRLLYDRQNTVFRVEDISTGTVWSTGVEEDYYTPERNTPAVRKDMRKLCQVGYTDFAGKDDSFSSTRTTVDITEQALENGVALQVYFPDYALGFTVEVWLNDYGLCVRVPADSIREEGNNGLTSISLFPMLGAATDSADGFAVYPDGAGSLFSFAGETEANRSPVTTPVYFPLSFDLDEMETDLTTGRYNLSLPAYGLSRGSSAVTAYITQGDATSSVTLNPSGYIYDINRMNATCTYRKSYTYVTPGDIQVIEMERELSAGDFCTQYLFQTQAGGTVSYADMAAALRSFLQQTGRLPEAGDGMMKTNVQLLMGTTADGMLGSSFEELTSFEEARRVVEALDADTRTQLRVLLLGWERGGYGVYPAGGTASRHLGGSDSLKDLSGWLKENDIESYLVINPVDAQTGGLGFNQNADAAYNARNLPLTNGEADRFLLNPLLQLQELIDKRLPYMQKLGATGVGFDAIGNRLFDDYRAGRRLTRQQAAQAFATMTAETEKAGLKVAAQSGNAYLLSGADYLYDLPETNAGLSLMTRAIPFYQMVVHGSVPYSGTMPGNMAPDFELEKLRWVEYGCEPYFVLQYQSSDRLKGTAVTEAFATDYQNWIQVINACAKEFREELGFTAGQAMIGHDVLDNGVVRVTYAHGERIYINYSDESLEADGVTVSARSYTVVK